MAPEASSSCNMNGLKGYSDFFASGLATVGKELISRRPRQRTRPTSIYSTISSTTTDSSYSASYILLPYGDKMEESLPSTPTRHRPTSMHLAPASAPQPRQREGRARATFSQLSSRLWDTLSLFPIPDPLTTPTAQGSKERKFPSFPDFMRSPNEKGDTQDLWIDDTDSCPETPVSSILPKHKRQSIFDPFGPLPDSKSFFVDFPDTPSPRKPSSQPQQPRTSFLSTPTTASPPTTPTRPVARSPTGSSFSASTGTSSANSFVQLSRQDVPRSHRRRRSVHHSRQSSYQSTTSSISEQVQAEYCTPEDEEPLQGHFGERDPAATIDWRQFHSDLMEVEA